MDTVIQNVAHYGFHVVCAYFIYITMKAQLQVAKQTRQERIKARRDSALRRQVAEATLERLHKKVLLQRAKANINRG